MTNKHELKPCADAVEALEQAMYNANQWHADTQYKAGSKDVAEVCIELLSQSGYIITRAEPAAPSSDEVEDAFAYITPHPENHSAISLSANKLRGYVNTLHAHIAALEADVLRLNGDCSNYLLVKMELEADNKLLREALQKYASAKVTCEFVDGGSRTFEVHESCEKWAQEALAQTDGKAGE